MTRILFGILFILTLQSAQAGLFSSCSDFFKSSGRFSNDAREDLEFWFPERRELLKYAKSIDNYWQWFSMRTLMKVDDPDFEFIFKEILPQVSLEQQYWVFERIEAFGRAEDKKLLKFALGVTTQKELSLLEFALREGVSTEEIVQISIAEDIAKWKLKFLSRPRIKKDLKSLPHSKEIAENKEPGFTIIVEGFLRASDGLKKYHAPRFGTNRKIYYPWEQFAISTKGNRIEQIMLVPENYIKGDQIEKFKRQVQFTYDIFAEQAKSRSHFHDDFIRLLEEEDDRLPISRQILFKFQNSKRQQIGFFSLFQGYQKGVVPLEMPFLLKQKDRELQRFVQDWIVEQNADQVFEVRRLAIHPSASQIDVTTIIKSIVAQTDSMAGKTLIMAHTDAAGKRFFESRSVGMSLLRELGPDDYVLFIDVKKWKEMYNLRN